VIVSAGKTLSPVAGCPLLFAVTTSKIPDPENLSKTLICLVVPMSNKMKTHKGSKKRFRLTAKGKAKHRNCGTSHLNTRMSSKRKRKLRGTTTIDSTMEPHIRTVLGKYSN
jgi:large subunit ribosomal protein L35